MEEVEALLILNNTPLGSKKIRQLMHHFGSAAAVLEAPFSELALFPGCTPSLLKLWKKEVEEEQGKKELALAAHMHTQLIPFTSPFYPKRLLEIDDYPLILYCQGTLTKEDQRCLALVGTRQATHYGLEMAMQLSRELAQAGFTIVSGLARGIDTAVHRGALEKGRTIAVLGSGLTSIYPIENKELSDIIQQNGTLISEFSMATPPHRFNFPQRNRIVSGMSMGTVLIEAPQRGGAMLTAEQTRHQGRPLFALPGRVDQENFKGNHALIKEGKAHLIENADDILHFFNQCPLPLNFKNASIKEYPGKI